MSKRDQLDSYLKQVEKRLRLEITLRGAAILMSAALGATVILVLVTNALAFSEGSISEARLVLLFTIVVALGAGSILPLYALNRRRTAGKIEAAFPFFQQRLLTFVDRESRQREPFMELLAADTLELARKAEPGGLMPDRRLVVALAVALACLGVLIWMVIAGPGFWGYGAARLWALSSRSHAAFYDIWITPGDAVVRRNAPQTITAQLIGFQNQQVRLYARSLDASKWEETAMQPQTAGPGFQFIFGGISEDLEYYVEAGLVRSRHFTIRVADLASVKQIRVLYHYPAWTGMPDAVEENGGDLRAVEGTEAQLSILTDRPVRGGVLVLENQQQILLSGGGGNVYRGAIRIEEDGQYHLAGLDQRQLVRLSDDFFIEARKVSLPEVSITRPGGDYRASPIEEVILSVKAHDDYGLNEVGLHYSVNGGPEQTVDLLKQQGAKEVERSTTLYLEDLKLVPGDVVSVYAKAKDSNSESRSGILFIQAEPFQREYSQSQASGGGGGQEFDIAQHEKEIIGATWQQQGNKTATKQQATETAKFLSDVQDKLRAQASTLGGRLESRELTDENDSFRAFQQDMNTAAGDMGQASAKLKAQEWSGAIPEEEKALQHLLRAEATFRQIQVAFGNSGGGGGGGASAGGDLAHLLNLELDTEKNQYEAGQTEASASQRAEQLDKALQRLDELARRQQDLANQQRDSSNQGSQQRWQQEMLRRQAEQLQKQVEQLAQGNSQGQAGSQTSSQMGSWPAAGPGDTGRSQMIVNQRIQRALDQLRQANDDMRRAVSQGQNGADARRAADRLQQATRMLEGLRQQQGSDQLDSLVQEADRVAGEEHDQSARIRRIFGQRSPAGSQPESGDAGGGGDETAKLADSRQLMAGDLSRLEKAAQDAARQLESGNRDAASKLHQALGEIDGSNLQSHLQHSAESMRLGLPPDDSLESSISAEIDSFDRRMHEADQARKGQQSPDDVLERLERLRRQVDALTRSLGNPDARRQEAGGRFQARQQSQGGQHSESAGQGQGGQQGEQAQAGSQAQQGEDAQAGQGGTASGFQPGGPGGPRMWRGDAIGPGNHADEGRPEIDSSDSSAELSRERALAELEGLRPEIRGKPDMEADIQQLLRDLQRLGPSNYGNPALVEQLRARVLAAMDSLELRLRRDLDQQGQVRNGDWIRVPQGYQESVAEYFRRLSKTH